MHLSKPKKSEEIAREKKINTYNHHTYEIIKYTIPVCFCTICTKAD